MRTRMNRSIAGLIIALLASVTFALPLWAGEMGLNCGNPENGGWIVLWVTVIGPGGATFTGTVELSITGPADWDAEEKALFLRESVPSGFGDKLAFSGTGTQVIATGMNGWRVAAMGIDHDETNEPDEMMSYVTPTEDWGFCSLSGTATGESASGGQGLFRLAVAGHEIVVPTDPGMQAEVVEQQVLSQLLALGVNARIATPEDLALLIGVGHDGTMLAIEGLDEAGLAEHVQDTGLVVDVAGLANPPPPPADPLATIPGTEPDGSSISFGVGALPPIPAGFFGPGSDPFVGTVPLRGEPFNEGTSGDASTMMQRSRHPFKVVIPPDTLVVIPTEMVSLSLVSYAVIVPGGQGDAWNVFVDPSVFPAPWGTLECTKTHWNGGTFSSQFNVQPRFTFVRVSDGHHVEWDTGLHGLPPLVFTAADGYWVHDVNSALGIIAPSAGDFVPGVAEVVPGDPSSQELRRLHAYDVSGAASLTFYPARMTSSAVPPVSANALRIHSNPNPFSPNSRIAYSMAERGPLSIKIYNVRGQMVRALIDEVSHGGDGLVTWDGADDRGAMMPTGVYFCKLTSPRGTASTTITLVR